MDDFDTYPLVTCHGDGLIQLHKATAEYFKPKDTTKFDHFQLLDMKVRKYLCTILQILNTRMVNVNVKHKMV